MALESSSECGHIFVSQFDPVSRIGTVVRLLIAYLISIAEGPVLDLPLVMHYPLRLMILEVKREQSKTQMLPILVIYFLFENLVDERVFQHGDSHQFDSGAVKNTRQIILVDELSCKIVLLEYAAIVIPQSHILLTHHYECILGS